MSSNRVLRSLGILLGLVFVTAGLGKVFMFTPFAEAISGILRVRGIAPGIVAGVVILIELSGGVGLLAGYRSTLSASLLFLATCVFILVLSAAIIQGKEVQCHCFGILNFRLSNREELILDILLLNLLAFFAFFSTRQKRVGERKIVSVSLIVIGFFLFAQYAVIGPLLRSGRASGSESLPAVAYCEQTNPAFANFRSGNRLLFLLDFPDFNCPPCFEDFITLCDAIAERFPAGDSARCFFLFKKGEMANPEAPERLAQWIRASGLRFPSAIGPDSLFEVPKFEKSFVAVISPSGSVLFREVLPIGTEKRDRVLELLAKSYDPSR